MPRRFLSARVGVSTETTWTGSAAALAVAGAATKVTETLTRAASPAYRQPWTSSDSPAVTYPSAISLLRKPADAATTRLSAVSKTARSQSPSALRSSTGVSRARTSPV